MVQHLISNLNTCITYQICTTLNLVSLKYSTNNINFVSIKTAHEIKQKKLLDAGNSNTGLIWIKIGNEIRFIKKISLSKLKAHWAEPVSLTCDFVDQPGTRIIYGGHVC